MPIRIASTLPQDTEVFLERIIGAALEVHRQLGPGFLESVYCAALAIELGARGIPFGRERTVRIEYRGQLVGSQRIDMIVANAVVVEVKASARTDPVFEAQVISYLKAVRLRAGLLINFNSALLKDGLKRIVL